MILITINNSGYLMFLSTWYVAQLDLGCGVRTSMSLWLTKLEISTGKQKLSLTQNPGQPVDMVQP
jgi:hypothetical protein